MFSCAFETMLPLAALPTLSVTFGLVACEVLTRLVPQTPGLSMKWPNDIQWCDAKLAGLLTETTSYKAQSTRAGPDRRRVVIGMGMNLRGAARLSEVLGRPIADWSLTGCRQPIERVVASLAQAWQETVTWAESAWNPAQGFVGLATRFAHHDALTHREITVQDHGRILHRGRAQGIDDFGRLQVDTATSRVAVTAGDISVRPAAFGHAGP